MTYYPTDGSWAVDPTPLAVGDRVKVAGDRLWWNVAAVSAHFVALVRQATFEPKGTPTYTVLDWRNGVRGPCDLIGQGYDIESVDAAGPDCERMLAGFEYDPDRDPEQIALRDAAKAEGRDSWPAPQHEDLAVSQRNWVRINITDHRPLAAQGATRG